MILRPAKHIIIPLLTLSMVFLSCSENQEAEEQSYVNEDTIKIKTSLKTELEDNQIRVLTLPTPIQVAAIIKSYGIPYNQEFLTPLNETKTYSSNYSRAICSGIYAVNLGYSAVSGDNNNSFQYLDYLSTLLDEMSVKTYPINKIQKRFGDNIENPDSLSKIILETYNKAHQYLMVNEQEQQGFFILAGSYLEGLDLISKIYSNGYFATKNNLFKEIYTQHQIFLNNLLEISAHTTGKHSDALELDFFLHELNDSFEKFDIKNVEGELVFGNKPKKEDIISIQQKIAAFKAKLVS